MLNYKVAFGLWSIALFSCSTTQKGIFSKKTPHETYAGKLAEAGLKETTMGSKWFAAANKGIQQPVNIELPYRETGYFPVSDPDAAGFKFNARHGENVQIAISTTPAGFSLFADVWMQQENGSLTPIASADTTGRSIQFEADKDALYQLRIQPQLLMAASYTLTIITAPSLVFPVPATANPKVGSFWGASRDAGARKHEGIDIFGKFRTPVVAAADGVVSSTRENNLGGKVVFLRPDNKNYSLYYAHLDSHLVNEGQRVRAGEPVGLMGNTGNARNTPTHLHFGIYTHGGAVDPYPFVNAARPVPAPVKAPENNIDSFVRNNKKVTVYTEASDKSAVAVSLSPNNPLKVLAATGNWYKVKMPGTGREGFVISTAVSPLGKKISNLSLVQPVILLDQPDSGAAVKAVISAKSNVAVLAEETGYYLTEYNTIRGWISK